ncbi:MAG: helix-turn-helix domain-containing protein [Planctomycetia bacterium]
MGTDTEEPNGLSLQELSDETGVEPRTIRSYVERGVIPGPESLGRGARYPRETLDRLKVLQLLRDANRSLTLDQIRVLLHSIGSAQLRAIAAGELRIGGVVDTDAAAQAGTPKRAALDYLQSLEALRTPARSPRRDAGVSAYRTAPDLADDSELTTLENAARALAGLVGMSASGRTARGEHWYRISLTPDIELSVRGEFGTEQLAQLHRIGDALRTLLTKGPSK